jgi:hypothetical protein
VAGRYLDCVYFSPRMGQANPFPGLMQQLCGGTRSSCRLGDGIVTPSPGHERCLNPGGWSSNLIHRVYPPERMPSLDTLEVTERVDQMVGMF